MSVIVIQFITLDGIVSDPDGSDGTSGSAMTARALVASSPSHRTQVKLQLHLTQTLG